RRRRRARLVGRLARSDALAKLSVVLGLVIVAPRLGDETVGADRPLLEAGDAHGLAGLGARAGERPVVFDDVVSDDEVVHEDLDVREGCDERLGDARYRGWFAAVDGDCPARDVVGRDAPRVATAPRFGVFPCELLDLLPITEHVRATLN